MSIKIVWIALKLWARTLGPVRWVRESRWMQRRMWAKDQARPEVRELVAAARELRVGPRDPAPTFEELRTELERQMAAAAELNKWGAPGHHMVWIRGAPEDTI